MPYRLPFSRSRGVQHHRIKHVRWVGPTAVIFVAIGLALQSASVAFAQSSWLWDCWLLRCATTLVKS